MRLEAYIDESGDDGGFPIQIVGGYVVRPEDARFVETAWAAVLESMAIFPTSIWWNALLSLQAASSKECQKSAEYSFKPN
ncbi:hypothetical protein X753_16040 [Mesorhizobium sp. LNJC399B00]|nr:hypothetical protein X753_16040 [Mesorhizobium sp. LNJC399B00]